MAARKVATEPIYRIRNRKRYDDAPVNRGSLTLRVDPATLQAGRSRGPARPGAQFRYGDLAIQGVLTLPAVFHLPLRAAEGLARSVLGLMGLDLEVADYAPLGRRSRALPITPPREAHGPLHLVPDSTGLEVDGEGESEVRQHGYSRRRTWLKLPLAIDPESQEIQAAMVTDPGVTDAEAVPDLVGQVREPVTGACGDGACDRRVVSEGLGRRGPGR